MKSIIILFFVATLLFKISPLDGMQELMNSTGSALVIGGGALFLQGIHRQHELFMPRLCGTSDNCHVPLRVDDFIRKTIVPIVGGGAMFGMGLFLMLLSKNKIM